MDEQFARNSRLFGALERHTLVATNWVNAQVADLSYINRPHVALPAGMAYAYGARVAALYRDRGIGSCVKQHLLNVLRQEGVEVVVIAALMRNLAGKRWHLANGFQPWGRAIYLQWRGRDLWWNHLTELGRRRYPDLLGHVEQSHPSPVPLGAH
jgi:hypothetical protein